MISRNMALSFFSSNSLKNILSLKRFVSCKKVRNMSREVQQVFTSHQEKEGKGAVVWRGIGHADVIFLMLDSFELLYDMREMK